MSHLPYFTLRVPALALAAALAVPAGADEVPGTADTAIHVSQTFFPKAGAVDIERSKSLVIGPIKADYAYAQGITGKGVTIAIMDTGIDAGHREFAEAGKLMTGYNAVTGTTDVTDHAGHGTHVAGILGAGRDGKGMFGVAYDARLLPIKVFSDSGEGSTVALDKGLRYAIGKAAIVSMSLGASTPIDSRALQEAVRAGLLVVAAAGNSGKANPEWPARFAKASWAGNRIIAVGAVDANNRIASFSNRAGDTAAWFLVAPGVGIPSPYEGTNLYAYMSGTSMATPVVSGAAALIKQMWSYLRADQIASILFMTATDLGTPGIDPIYGRGLVNVEKALQPVGTVKTTTWNGVAIKVLDSSIKPSLATSKLWNLAASGALRVVGLDDFNRGFDFDLGAGVSKPATLSLDQVFGRFDRRVQMAERVLANGARLSAVYESAVSPDGRAAPVATLAAFAFVSNYADGREIALGSGGLAAHYFGVGGMRVADGLAALPALAHPYFALVPSASHGGLAQDFGGGVKLKLGLLSSGLNGALASQSASNPTPVSLGTAQRADLALAELSKSFGHAALSVSVSRTSEANAYLGARSNGAFAFFPNTATSAIQMAGAWRVAPNLAIAGQAAYGITTCNAGGNSLIAEMTDTRTNAFSIALVASDRIVADDRLSVVLSQPMRTYAGSITLDTIAGLDGNGAEVRERRSFSMVPVARELMAEMNYRAPLGKDASGGLALSVRRNPNNLRDVPMEKLLAMRYVRLF